jgi:hypothetical protein
MLGSATGVDPVDGASRAIGASTNAITRGLMAPVENTAIQVYSKAFRRGINPAAAVGDVIRPWRAEPDETLPIVGLSLRIGRAIHESDTDDTLRRDQRVRIEAVGRDRPGCDSRRRQNMDTWNIAMEGRGLGRFGMKSADDPLNVIGIGRVTPLVRGARAGNQAQTIDRVSAAGGRCAPCAGANSSAGRTATDGPYTGWPVLTEELL